jgi:predicted deacetylase
VLIARRTGRGRICEFEVEYPVAKSEEVMDLIEKSRHGGYEIMVDAGLYQDAYRKVSTLVDMANIQTREEKGRQGQ